MLQSFLQKPEKLQNMNLKIGAVNCNLQCIVSKDDQTTTQLTHNWIYKKIFAYSSNIFLVRIKI